MVDMRKLAYLFVGAIVIGCSGEVKKEAETLEKVEKEIGELSRSELMKLNRVKEVTAVAKGFKFGEVSGEELRLYQCHFDDEGRTLDSLIYKGNSLHLSEHYEYNDEGVLLKKTLKDSAENIIHQSVRELDDSGNEIVFRAYRMDTLYYSEQKDYSDSGELIKITIYDQEGNPFGINEFTYNEKGDVLTKTEIDQSGIKLSKTMYKYDGKSRVSTVTYYDVSGQMKEKTLLKEYDSNNNAQLVEKYNADDSLVAYYVYEYDSEGREIKCKIHDGVSRVLRQDNTDYNELGKRTKLEIYEMENGLMGTEILKYDQYGFQTELIDKDREGNQIKRKVTEYGDNHLLKNEINYNKIDEPTVQIQYTYEYH